MIIPQQTRYVDPFSDIESIDVNQRLMSVYPNGKGCLYGLTLANPSQTTLVISSGVALQDYVTLSFPNDTTISTAGITNQAGWNYVVIQYQYQLVSPPPVASFTIEPVGSYNPNTDVIIGEIELDANGNILAINYTNRDGNPLATLLPAFLQQYGINGILNMNGNSIINLANPVNPTDAATKQYVDNSIGFVKVSASDTGGYLDTKLTAGQFVTITPITTANGQELQISSEDNFVSVTAADSGRSFL
jgi:hypothetical protein